MTKALIAGALLLIVAVGTVYGLHKLSALSAELATAQADLVAEKLQHAADNVAHTAVLKAVDQVSKDQEAVTQRLVVIRKVVRSAPVTSSCGPAIERALSGLRPDGAKAGAGVPATPSQSDDVSGRP